MHSALLRRYHQLPPVLRSAVATVRGGYLRAWRSGRDFDDLRDEFLARESWDTGDWNRWREERLGFVLHRAATRVPFYRQRWSERRRRGDRASWEQLENWPILEKESLRANPRAFVADDCSTARMFRDHTSGTTGKSLDIWLTRRTVRAWYALNEARARVWYGVDRRDRWAIFGGQLVAPASQEAPPFWVWNAALKQLYMSSYHLSPRHVSAYLDALRRREVRYVLGYPSALYSIAREVVARGLRAPQLAVAIANAEPLMAHQRVAIERAFHCRVRETYGMSEVVAAASECEHHRMHLWPEVGWLEVFNADEPMPMGSVGDFVATGLFNADMPLVRYRLGDRGAIGDDSARCRCGRSLPVLASLEGRSDDVLYTPDGREVGRMDPVFKSSLPIREAQIVQERLDSIRVRFVPAERYTPEDGESLAERIRERLGPVEVVLEECDRIPRTSNGKFRAVICALPAEERERAPVNA
jgi:phenylacetate-CoA ligase